LSFAGDFRDHGWPGNFSMPDDAQLDAVLSGCLARLAKGDKSAREEILEVCNERLRTLSSRLLGKFAKVRRWDNTDDVAQNAALRLYRALGETVPDSPRGLMGLMAVQIERELIDLARKHAGPMSYAANHGTNVREGTSGDVFLVDEAEEAGDSDDEIPLARWESFHAAVESLPEEHREVFRLVWYLGADRETAAKNLGLSVRTVGRRWLEARELVTQALAEEEGAPGGQAAG
jgi:RNA polymerase sigma-70 factor (ECF subfamily)